MAIIDLQRRIHEAGRIRIGQQVPAAKGKRPVKLSTFRITSPNRDRIDAAARLYGGEPREWEAPAGIQWEVITTTDRLRVIVPPTELAFTQHYELWAASGCQRRCNGQAEQISDGPCLCDPDARECKVHTRLSVMLADMPGLGVWRLESQGWNAALELQGAVEVIHLAARHGQLLPATLRLEQRMTKRPGEGTRRFAVPVLDLDVTPAQMMGATRFGPALDKGEQPELVESVRSIAAAPVELDRPSNDGQMTPDEAQQWGDANPSYPHGMSAGGAPLPPPSDNRPKEFHANVTPADQQWCPATWRTIKCTREAGHDGKHRGETQAGESREWATAGKMTPVPDDNRPPPTIAEQAEAEVKSRRRAPIPPPPTLAPRPAAEAAAARDQAERTPPAPRPADGSQTASETGHERQGEATTRPHAASSDLLPSAPDAVPCPATYGPSRLQCNRAAGHPGQHNVTTDSARYAWGDGDPDNGQPARVCQCGDPDRPGSHSAIHCVHAGPGQQCGTCGARGEHAPGCPEADPTDPGGDDTPEGPATTPQNRKMHALFRELGLTDRQDRLVVTSRILGYELTTSGGMTISEAGKVIETCELLFEAPEQFTLSNGQRAGSYDQWITDVINTWAIQQQTGNEE